jgi:hypothetical protein
MAMTMLALLLVSGGFAVLAILLLGTLRERRRRL